MTVTRAVIDAMIDTGCPEAQAAGLAECLQISTIHDVNSIVAAFPGLTFVYAMSIRREFRISFILWHNANCDLIWELKEGAGTWEDIDWPQFEQDFKQDIIAFVSGLQNSQSTA